MKPDNTLTVIYGFGFFFFYFLFCGACCAEIVDFCEFLSPTVEEKAARDMAIESVFGVIKHIWPHCRVETFLVIALHHFVVEFYVSTRFLLSSFSVTLRWKYLGHSGQGCIFPPVILT